MAGLAKEDEEPNVFEEGIPGLVVPNNDFDVPLLLLIVVGLLNGEPPKGEGLLIVEAATPNLLCAVEATGIPPPPPLVGEENSPPFTGAAANPN